MQHLNKTLARLASYALGGGVWRDQVGMSSLQRFQFIHQPIEISVVDFGLVENVIPIFVVADLLSQTLDFFVNILGCSCRH
jgi:hypothetical protein